MQAVAQWLLMVSELPSRSHLQDQVAAPMVAPQVAGERTWQEFPLMHCEHICTNSTALEVGFIRKPHML